MDQTVTCDSCQADISIQLKQRRLRDGVDLSYFDCPECGKEYPCYYTNTAIRAQQKKVGDLWTRFHNTKDTTKRQQVKDRIDREQAEISRQIDELKLQI